jgi:hypothetical protein
MGREKARSKKKLVGKQLNKLNSHIKFAKTAVTFEQKRLQQSYALGLKMMSVWKFSAIFEIGPMETPADRAPDVKVLHL